MGKFLENLRRVCQMFANNQKKVVLILGFLCVVYFMRNSENSINYDQLFDLSDESSKLEVTPYFKDHEPRDTRSIFFLNTSDVSDGIQLKARQACAVESAAVINPDRQIYLLITEKVDFSAHPPNPVTAALLTYSNINLMYFNPFEVIKGSVLDDWFNTSSVLTSPHRVVHFSDIFRLLMMRQYGGVYMDLDMLALQNFDELPDNFACLEMFRKETDLRPGNAFLGFNGELGNTILDIYLNEIREHYNPDGYSNNGPDMLTRILNRFCNETDIRKMTEDACQGFSILAKTKCFDITFKEWYDLFDVKKTNETIARLTKNEAVVTHYFTSVSKNHKFPSTEINAFTTLAKKLCPKVMENVGEFIQ